MSEQADAMAMARPQIDWSLGEYERTAAFLEPAAAHALRRARLAPGDKLLDLACGTGNATLLAARAGAEVTGLDSATRLLEVARARATSEGLAASFVEGDFHSLAFPDATFGVAISVFGVIFGDPSRILPEVLRVLRPGGRVVLTTWLPEGTIHAYIGGIIGLFSEAIGMSLPQPFPWHDPDALRPFVEPGGWQLASEDASLSFTAASPAAFLDEQERYSPAAVSFQGLVDHFGLRPRIRERSLATLEAGNEDPSAFRVTSRYRVLEISRTLPHELVG